MIFFTPYGLGLWCLMPLSIIFHLYHGGHSICKMRQIKNVIEVVSKNFYQKLPITNLKHDCHFYFKNDIQNLMGTLLKL
jgi:hypothetical protein